MISKLREKLDEAGIPAENLVSAKNFYSIYRKTIEQEKDLGNLDLIAVRAIVNTVKECYATLGIVHTMWKPYQGALRIILQCLNRTCISRCIPH